MTATQNPVAAAIAVNRFGLGARPGELSRAAGDPQGWLLKQLKGSPPVLTGEGLESSADFLKKALELRQDLIEARRAKKSGDASSEKAVAAALKLPAISRPV